MILGIRWVVVHLRGENDEGMLTVSYVRLAMRGLRWTLLGRAPACLKVSVSSVRTCVVLFVCAAGLLMSCSAQYSVQGRSTQSILEGRMAYIRVMDESGSRAIDSCEVLHGKFTMQGALDSVMLVQLSLGGEDFIPIVLEEGSVSVDVGNASVRIGGTVLNERLFAFLTARDSLNLLRAELPREETRMILQGYSEDDILDYLGQEEMALVRAIDDLETRFIKDNYDNVLGVSWFLQLCAQAYRTFGYPTTTPQIDELYFHAPESFKTHPDIARYMNACQ